MFEIIIIMQAITDWYLCVIVAIITLIDLILLSLVTALPHARNSSMLVQNKEYPSSSMGVSIYIYIANNL